MQSMLLEYASGRGDYTCTLCGSDLRVTGMRVFTLLADHHGSNGSKATLTCLCESCNAIVNADEQIST